MASLFI